MESFKSRAFQEFFKKKEIMILRIRKETYEVADTEDFHKCLLESRYTMSKAHLWATSIITPFKKEMKY